MDDLIDGMYLMEADRYMYLYVLCEQYYNESHKCTAKVVFKHIHLIKRMIC